MPAVSECPICKRAIAADAVAPRPFCSPRCRAIDLGSWLEGRYRIGSAVEDSDDEGTLVEGGDDAGVNRR